MNQILDRGENITFANILDTQYINELRNWRNQDFVRRNMTNHDLIGVEEHERYIEHLRRSKTDKAFLAMNCGEPLAVITIKIDWDSKCIEPGTYIINEKYLGKGYGIIMSYARIEYIFELIPDGRMLTTILDKNERNINLQKKMGCRFKEHIKVQANNGELEPASVFYLTKDVWDMKKPLIEERINCDFGLKNIQRITVR